MSAKRDTPGSQSLSTLRTLKACEEFLAALQAAPSNEDEPGVARFALTPGYHPIAPSGRGCVKVCSPFTAYAAVTFLTVRA